jgi:uncharacterized protein YjbJ (UPF0337 family)
LRCRIGALNALTRTILWCVVFFIASAGASSAYLTVSEIFPIEPRAQAISFFFAISQFFGGVIAPALAGARGEAAVGGLRPAQRQLPAPDGVGVTHATRLIVRTSGYMKVAHDEGRRLEMGFDDKVENQSENLAGKVKEGVGKATDDERLEAEGKGDQVKANLKQAGEKVKDAFKS